MVASPAFGTGLTRTCAIPVGLKGDRSPFTRQAANPFVGDVADQPSNPFAADEPSNPFEADDPSNLFEAEDPSDQSDADVPLNPFEADQPPNPFGADMVNPFAEDDDVGADSAESFSEESSNPFGAGGEHHSTRLLEEAM